MSAVASRNPFDLLSDETPAAPAATPKSAETPKTDAPSARGGQRGRSGPASRGGRYYQRGGAAGSAPREQAETTEDAPREGKRLSEERGRGRGRGGRGRGDRGDRGRAGGHGRPFDKHSMTGKTDSEKKINQGWGADEGDKELKAEEEGFKDAAAEAPANDPWATDAAPAAADDAWGTPAVETSGDAAKDAAPAEARRNREEEEDNTLTLDQYLAQQKEKITVPKLENVRKANDGDDGLFKDAVQVLKDNEDDVYFAAKTKAAKQRAKKEDKKQVIEIDGQFSDRQTRGGRGGRGGDRGGDRGARGGGRGRGSRGRGRGEFQGANGSNRPVNVDDQTAFPSLS